MPPKRRFTDEEKQQLLANLDLEVAHRTLQFEQWLSDTLADFRIRHEGHILRIPHIVRGITMAEFGDKWNGDIQACVRGLQQERIAVDSAPIDRTAMKRKWVASQDHDVDGEGAAKPGVGHDGNPARAAKNPRIMAATPKKKPSFTTSTAASRARLPTTKTPGTARAMGRVPSFRAPSPSPQKFGRAQPQTQIPHSHARSPSRPASPSKATTSQQQTRPARPPSSATFNPAIPKTPAYPPRWPRKDESMLSVNGSPLANPYELGLNWLANSNSPRDEDGATDDDRDQPKARATHSRTNSIVVRRDASFASSSGSQPNGHSRQNSHSQLNSNMNSNANLMPTAASRPKSQSGRPLAQLGSASSGHISARVAVPTKDGHMLEFDPLQTSPGELDKLEGITESAKKQAKEDMFRLVQAAVAKWNIAP